MPLLANASVTSRISWLSLCQRSTICFWVFSVLFDCLSTLIRRLRCSYFHDLSLLQPRGLKWVRNALDVEDRFSSQSFFVHHRRDHIQEQEDSDSATQRRPHDQDLGRWKRKTRSSYRCDNWLIVTQTYQNPETNHGHKRELKVIASSSMMLVVLYRTFRDLASQPDHRECCLFCHVKVQRLHCDFYL